MKKFFLLGILLALEVKSKSGPKLDDFKAKLNEEEFQVRLEELKDKVHAFASKFPLPGYEEY